MNSEKTGENARGAEYKDGATGLASLAAQCACGLFSCFASAQELT
jgi:hypothetical protein